MPFLPEIVLEFVLTAICDKSMIPEAVLGTMNCANTVADYSVILESVRSYIAEQSQDDVSLAQRRDAGFDNFTIAFRAAVEIIQCDVSDNIITVFETIQRTIDTVPDRILEKKIFESEIALLIKARRNLWLDVHKQSEPSALRFKGDRRYLQRLADYIGKQRLILSLKFSALASELAIRGWISNKLVQECREILEKESLLILFQECPITLPRL